MPMPYTYRHSSEEWRGFLRRMRERTLIESDNVIYTALQGLFRAFRARTEPHLVLAFGDELPSVMRAILVANWDLDAPRQPWVTPEEIEREVRAFRQAHNIAPVGILGDLIPEVRAEMHGKAFERVIARLPIEGQRLWRLGA